MKSYLFALLGILGLNCGGCLPEKICWSPDGQQALVLADGLYVTDAKGKLNRLKESRVAFVSWFGDSKRFLAVDSTDMAKWDRVERALPPETEQEVIVLAERFRSEIIRSSEKDLGRMASTQGLSSSTLGMMKMYLATKHAEELKPKLGELWREFGGAKVEGSRIIMAHVENGQAKADQEVLEYPGGILHVSASPDGKLLAFTTQSLTKEGGSDVSSTGARLHVRQLSQGQAKTGSQLLETEVSWQFDWSPDSRSLLYYTAVGRGKDLNTGSIVKRRVASEAGELIGPPGQTEEVAAVLFSPFARLRWLPDGRIIFSSVRVELPATAGTLPTNFTLFVIHPGNAAVVSKLLPDLAYKTLPSLVLMFRLSPDAQWVSVPGEKGEVGIVELKTGRTQSPVEKGWLPENRYMPAPPASWRSARELCVMVPPGSPLGSPKRPEVVLYGLDGKHQCISKDWPDNVIKGLMSE